MMKTIYSLVFAVAFLFGLGGTTLCKGQAVAIGHVSAEIIESVSASSQAATNLIIGTTSASTSTNVNLRTMTVNSGNCTVNVVVKSATLSNSQGSSFPIDPTINNNTLASVEKSNDVQTIQLTGTANPATDLISGHYRVSYSVVFAYN